MKYILEISILRFKSTIKKLMTVLLVIYAQGPIFNTEGSAEIIGKDALNKAFDEILESKKIKAAVLRVDSPRRRCFDIRDNTQCL